jgi:hypothetical protein
VGRTIVEPRRCGDDVDASSKGIRPNRIDLGYEWERELRKSELRRAEVYVRSLTKPLEKKSVEEATRWAFEGVTRYEGGSVKLNGVDWTFREIHDGDMLEGTVEISEEPDPTTGLRRTFRLPKPADFYPQMDNETWQKGKAYQEMNWKCIKSHVRTLRGSVRGNEFGEGRMQIGSTRRADCVCLLGPHVT